MTHRVISVYTSLANRTNEDGKCWFAISTIANDLKLSQSIVRRALKDLRNASFVETEQPYRTKGGNSSLLFRLVR